MKADILNRWKRLQKPLDANFRYQLSVFSVCLGISLFIWLLIKLSREYSSAIRYEVEFEQLPTDRILTAASDSTIYLQIDQKGFDLFSAKYLSWHPPVRIDLSGLKYQTKGDSQIAKLATRSLVDEMARKLDLYSELASISPDTLYFTFKQRSHKKVAVKPNFKYQIARPYALYGPLEVTPDSIWISGIAEELKTTDFIETQFINFPDLTASKTVDMDLLMPAGLQQAELSREKIQLHIPVEQFTETRLKVPVQVVDPELARKLRIFPAEIELTCQLALCDFKKLDAGLFRIEAIVPPHIHSDLKFLRLEIQQQPDFVRVNRIRPEKVEFIILR